MTVTDVPVRNTVSDTGFTGVLSLPNVLVEDETHVKIYAGVTELSLGSDYSVTGVLDPNGPVVTILDPSAHRPTTDWTIRFAPPLDQAADLSLGGSFGLAYENAIDALARRFQSVAERLNRSLTLAVNYTGQPLSLPPGDPGKSFKWNETGDGLVNTVSDPDSYVADALAAAAEAKGYRNTTKTYRDEVVALAVEIDTIAGIAPELLAVYAIRTDITTVAGSNTEVVAVAQNMAAVLAVNANKTNIDTVAANLTGANTIGTVAGIAASVVGVAGISAAVSSVHANAANINVVSADLSGADTIGTVAGIAPAVTNVSGIATAVSNVNTIRTNVTTVAGIASDVSTLAPISAQVQALAAIDTELVAVYGIRTDVATAAANIAAIQAAPAAAAQAETARDFAFEWSSAPEDTPVDDGTNQGFSAFHWSEKAKAAASGSSDNITNASGVAGATVTVALDTLNASVTTAVPAGMKGQFAGQTPPPGWLKRNGAVLKRATYSALFAAIGTTYNTGGEASDEFRLPDDRGLFERSWDDGAGIDTGRTFGSIQQDQNKAHTHTGTAQSGGEHTHSGTAASAGAHTHGALDQQAGSGSGWVFTGMADSGSRTPRSGAIVSAGAHNHTLTINSGGAHSHTLSVDSEGGAEVRVKNRASLAIIKY